MQFILYIIKEATVDEAHKSTQETAGFKPYGPLSVQ